MFSKPRRSIRVLSQQERERGNRPTDRRECDATVNPAVHCEAAMSRVREAYRPIKRGGREEESQDVIGATKHGQIHVRRGVVGHATGSAYVESERGKVICAIFGPNAIERSHAGFSARGLFECFVRVSPFSFEARNSKYKDCVREYETVLSKKVRCAIEAAVRLERFPKSLIEAHLVVVESFEDIVSTAVTCTSIALADAGIDMNGLVVGLSDDDLATTSRGDLQRGTTMSIATIPAQDRITFIEHHGETKPKDVVRAIKKAMLSCKNAHARLRTVIVSEEKG